MAFGTYFEGVVSRRRRHLVLGLALAWIVSLVHLTGIRQSSTVPERLHGHQGGADRRFIVAGFAFGTPQPISFAPSAQDLGYIFSAPFAISLVFVMYSYSGWNAATYIINEVRDPEQSLPRSLFAATLIVLVLYVALECRVPLHHADGEDGRPDQRRADRRRAYLRRCRRPASSAALICIGLVSAVSAMIWIGRASPW